MNGDRRNAFLENGMPNARRAVSEETAQAIDQEVKALVEAGHQQALTVLKENRDLLETLATQLLEEEVIEGPPLRDMLHRVGTSQPDSHTPELSQV
jgi:cell division protease FtsH